MGRLIAAFDIARVPFVVFEDGDSWFAAEFDSD